MSRFDQVYRRLLISKFFTKGWGKPENLKRLFDFRQVIANRDTCQKLVPVDYPVYIDKEYVQGDVRTLEGHFVSPFTLCLPGVMPKEVEVAKFQVILPVTWKTTLRPVCLHLAGTGDHYFWRRRTLIAKPLLKEYGIGSIILENPYYGARKPRKQVRSSLHNVSDLFVMGGALVLESLALFHWCERQGFGPLAITGVSMGGHMASLAAVNWPRPVSLVPCLSWSTASIVFAQGVLRGAVPWGLLQSQYLEDSVYQNELRGLMHSPEQDDQHAYILGQQFVQDYNAGQHRRAVARQQVMKEPTDLSSEDVYFEQVSTNGRSRGDHDDSRYSNNGRSMLVGLARHFYEHRSHGRSSLEGEVLEFMRGVMDEFTHLSNFSMPVDTSLITIVTARHDAYMPRDSVRSLEEIWPGAEVRYINTGHIAAFLLKQDVFRKAIYDSICRQTEKYYS